MNENLRICSPKRNSRLQTGWEGFFPYYAGFPEVFAQTVLESADLPSDALVLDPWNGSGTTTYTASKLGFASVGFDLNPVMVIIARARLLGPSEADSIEPLANGVTKHARLTRKPLDAADPLTFWFDGDTAAHIRAIERSIRRRLVGNMTVTPAGTNLDRISGIAATFYVALFAVCRELVVPFRSSNPTWLRRPKVGEAKISAPRALISKLFNRNLASMAIALVARASRKDFPMYDQGYCDIQLANTACKKIADKSVDFVLTSPPYCTRIDYTSATRVELAVLEPFLNIETQDLARQLIGSTRVPDREIIILDDWGRTCNSFLESVRCHPSKASSKYYYKTHLDYFDKMFRSLANIAGGLKNGGSAIFVVQDSYYKDIHNNLPKIIGEMAGACGLSMFRSEEFHQRRSMSRINPKTRIYQRFAGAVESVLCFTK